MFTNKNKLIGLIALVVVIVLVVSAAIALIADSKIKSDAAEADKKIAALQSQLDAAQNNINTLSDKLKQEAATKAELEATVKELNTLKSNLESQIDALEGQIDTLEGNIAANKGAIDSLKATLDTVNGMLADANAKIEVLEAMTGAWDEVTPKVYDKLFAVTATYKDAMAKEALVDGFDGDALTEAYNDTWTAIIRARNDEQLNAAVDAFNKYVEENITKKAYDYIFGQLVNAIPEVVYGGEDDDAARIADAYNYYNNVIVGKAEAEVACADLKAALDVHAAKYEELKHNHFLNAYKTALDNLPALFHAVDNKAELDAVVAAWNALVAEYPAEQKDARHLAMETRLETIETVILPALDEMNALINKLDKDADGKLVIVEDPNHIIIQKLVALHADFAAVVVEADPYYTGLGIADLAKEFSDGVAEIWSNYNAFLAASTEAKLGIGGEMSLSDRQAAIDNAVVLGDKITPEDLSLLAVYYGKALDDILNPYLAALENIDKANAEVEAIETLVVNIKDEINKLIKVEETRPAGYETGVREGHLDTLEGLVAKLTALVGAANVDSTIGEEYVAKLAEVRLYPAQNAAYDAVNEYYNTLFDIANKDGKAELTVCKGQLFEAIAGAKTQADIDALLDTYKAQLDACLN